MPSFLGAFELSQQLLKNVDFIPDHDTKGSIPVTAKKTSFLQNSYQTLKLGPFSWGMNNHLFLVIRFFNLIMYQVRNTFFMNTFLSNLLIPRIFYLAPVSEWHPKLSTVLSTILFQFKLRI